ncbi:Formate hydrogenlyase subunit 3/Multisubunit Na+/H+ antiporter, MnhD subunit [Tistlia consotensis]|uniref:Formate hydrogenlyase subunit 3/Multisubunit Na+/H+ antiporter, MnhD subunit n=1 Tax=Tistlia consotensis USBA 355 TaxID=560819 RepID=A0A1Y6CK45_9PROT|nr:hydrogenase 4 subunit B [Tistlia consotensis]SMF58730.1 Formate hydrogenlyase subunit 3/Multisubunit Na+/H+ antiporter, MnhD subunit [Tistlia consotensis USBA 355]SNR63752.1 Formate hydrogenlyase subunit 3/Multisubunit Na+/H+ antiporter, MnhD subunit [Tistlia consotensis]
MSLLVVLCCVAALLGTAVLGVAAARRPAGRPLVYGASLLLCLLVLAAALDRLLGGGATPALTLPLGLPWIGARFALDPLAAFFLVVVALGGAAASLYGLGYGRHEEAPQRVLPFFPAFLAAMTLVVAAADAFSFLLSWEFMSLASWALVMAHHHEAENRRAGFVYLVMASFGTLSLLLTFGLLAGPGGAYGFAEMRAAAAGGHDVVAALVLALALLGAGSKAGLVPLHVWLPLAHPAAPSHVSGLMSGVMTKVAIYGFLRIVLDLSGGATWWSGIVLLCLGSATAVIGILHALMESDLKRLLAYSTIENVGVIFAGLGLAFAFKADGLGLAAALALTAALFHALNHSLFKSLLFFGAGAVMTATGERDLERLGGLIHRLPVTAVVALAGCLAISALPPLNGFASEWLLFQAVLKSPDLAQWGLKILVPAVGGLLALAAALAAACFVKLYGVGFLGRPRSPAAAGAREVERWMLAAMLGLAALCLAAGLLPGLVIDGLAPVTHSLLGAAMPLQREVPWLSIVPIAESRSSYNGLLVFLFMAISGGLAALAVHRLASRALRRGPAWGCGFPDAVPAGQYSAASFAQPIRRVFGPLLFAAAERVEMPPPGSLAPARFELALTDRVWETLYAPLGRAVGFAADRLNGLQFLTIRRYLSLVFLALVTLLLVLALWS